MWQSALGCTGESDVRNDLTAISSGGSLLKGRRWLALRFLVVSLLTNCLLWWLMDALDSGDHIWRQIPKWAQLAAVLPVVAAIYGLGFLILRGAHDMLIYALPAGKWKTRLIGDEGSNITSAEEFPELGRTAAFGPILILGLYLILVLLAVLVFSGLAAVYGLWYGFRAITAGWPSWAIVITVLLVLILFRQNRKRD